MSAPGARILASQLGYLCGARKRIVVPADAVTSGRGAPQGREAPAFEIQDVTQIDAQSLGAFENWKTVFRGKLEPHTGPMGSWFVGDFSGLTRPGHYRAVLPGVTAWSYPFIVCDNAYAKLPSMFLDWVHGQRCGDFENDLRGPCHLDDGVRSDNGAPVDAAGGWHDAGDLRKWMATTPLAILGFFALRNHLGYSRNNWRERSHEDDLLAESAWGLRWILKMQDPATGMFYEDVGGGGESRREPGMSWWYENHAGCYADNAGNYFSDNRVGTGDERSVRVQYNPIVQYLATTILLDAVDHFHAHYPAFSALCRDAALRCWEFMKKRRKDAEHGWTSVLSWRLLAALRLHAMGQVGESEVAALVSVLLDLQSAEHGFWFMDNGRKDPYRGIVNAAQPVIALVAFIESDYEHPLVAPARRALERCWERFVQPMLATNPFGMMPYGVYAAPRTKGDLYRPWTGGMVFRFFMPEHAPERVNHGLASHWTSWAHGLASMGRVLERADLREAAFDQLSWLMGCNPLAVSMVTGVGYHQATPYSRFHGPSAGGFCLGPRGTAEDEIYVDTEGRIVWSTGEYWMTPLANALMALSELIPARVGGTGKLGST
jgi:hypothetical protein